MTDVEVPGVGGVGKKPLIAIGVGGAAYVLYRYYKARQAAAAAAAAPADTPGYQDGSAVLPIVPGAQSGVGVANGETTTDVSGSAPTTNAAWTQAAEEFLTTAGYDPMSVMKALGDYLAHRALSADEQSIVQAAIAAAGYPPEGTYTIIPTGSGGSTSGVGQVQGLHSTAVTSNGFQINWYATNGANGYHVKENGAVVATDYGTYHPFTGRQPGTKYGPFTVAALNMDGSEGPESAPLYVTTTAAAGAPTASPSLPGWFNPRPTQKQPVTVTVQHGDTLSGIAARHGISMSQLRSWNPVYWTNSKYQNGNRIWAGDHVTVGYH